MQRGPRRPRRLAVLTLAALPLLLAAPTQAQERAPAEPDYLNEHGPRARILLVGAFHFGYPNLDAHKPEHRIDVLAPERQREVEEIVERLAAYRPTKVAVEVRPERQARLDSLYAAYVAGRAELPVGEEYQIGFRLARRLGHARVYAVDAERHDFFVDLAMKELAPREAELMETDRGWRERVRRYHARQDSLVVATEPTLREMFVALNSPEQIRRSHLSYAVGNFKFDGGEGGYLGADFVAGWYDRNLRIFRNLQRITASPEERLLLIIGSGHLPILRFVAQHSPEYELVEANDYLASPAAGR